jgi:hypothetical protein
MRREWGRALLLTPAIVGIVLLVGGIIWYAVLSNQINQNVAYQIRSQNQQIDPQSQTEAMGLIRAGEELRDLDHNRDIATILGGAGLVLIAASWLARDFVLGREKRQHNISEAATK